MGKRKSAMEKRITLVRHYEKEILTDVIDAYERQPQFGFGGILNAWKYSVGKLAKKSGRRGLVTLASDNIMNKLQASIGGQK